MADRIATPDDPHRADARERVVEELLVLRAQEGSRAALEALIARWQEPLWRHAFRLTGREDAAWDVLQESWIAVTSGLSRLNDPAAFRRWAYTIVTRAAVVRLRRMPREVTSPPDVLDDRTSDETEQDERKQAVELLRRALNQLDRNDRALVSLRYLEGFELWELARILGIPEGTVKSRLHRVRKQLKEVLERLDP